MNNEMIKKLDNILLGNNVKDEFHKAYNGDFKEWIDQIIPEIYDCSIGRQNNPWHIYNILDHILVSVEKINSLDTEYNDEDKRILSYTMLYHDTGKPMCHLERMKQGKMIDSFFNHNKASMKIALRSLQEFGFSEEEKNIIAKLVYDHDIFMFLTKDKTNNPYKKVLDLNYVQDKIQDLYSFGDGIKLNKMLNLVGYADSLAQNPEMTADSLKLLKTYDELSKKANNINDNIR